MAGAPIKLQLLADAPDASGAPRAGLLVPPQAGSMNKRPILRVFCSVGEALLAKRQLEAALAAADGGQC